MKITGITTLDHAPQVVAEWLNLLCDDLDWVDTSRAYQLLRETLHALRDYLTSDEAADLAAQLPLLIRGVYFDGWNPAKTPVHPRGKADFIDRIAARFPDRTPEEVEEGVVAVFDLLRRKISAGEIEQVANALRKSLRDLWT
jgi:uncharacterized protein (DUF2267 family)